VRKLTRFGLAAITAAVAAVPGFSGALVANAVTTNCAGLQAALNAGGTVVLSDSILCTGAYTLPTAVVLQGADAAQGFDGASHADTPSLAGDDSGPVTIQNLTFVNNSNSLSTPGAALRLNGDVTPRILDNRFFDNSSSGGVGGGAAVNPNPRANTIVVSGNTFGSPGHGNSALYYGGGLTLSGGGMVTITNNTFNDNSVTDPSGAGNGGGGMSVFYFASTNGNRMTIDHNTFVGNDSRSSGGGATVLVNTDTGITADVVISENVFRANHISSSGASGVTALGGGLVTENYGGGGFTQVHNLFEKNVIDPPRTVDNPEFDYGGGGEWISGGITTSLNDTFLDNVVNTPETPNGAVGVGGGLAARGTGESNGVHVTATNMVVGGNTVGAEGEGGGIYAGGLGCRSDNANCPAEVRLNDSTVVGNTSGGSTGGIAGDDTDILHLANDIVTPNTGKGDSLAGFGTMEVQYTDACNQSNAAYTGTGNTCADPLLVSPTAGAIDVHQTAASPTRNAGLDSLVTVGVTEDYEGDARIQEAAVDMGADEFTPVAPGLPAAGARPAGAIPDIAVVLVALALALACGLALQARRAG
jgi:hypothetical protein